jgi:hypothetical protein
MKIPPPGDGCIKKRRLKALAFSAAGYIMTTHLVAPPFPAYPSKNDPVAGFSLRTDYYMG